MTTELEKTQLEIARLQLEQERQKLAKMQRRQQAVDGLGQGAAAVGGGIAWVLGKLLAAGIFIVGGSLAGLMLAVMAIILMVDAPPGLSLLEGVGYRLGAHQTVLIVSMPLGIVFTALVALADKPKR